MPKTYYYLGNGVLLHYLLEAIGNVMSFREDISVLRGYGRLA